MLECAGLIDSAPWIRFPGPDGSCSKQANGGKSTMFRKKKKLKMILKFPISGISFNKFRGGALFLMIMGLLLAGSSGVMAQKQKLWMYGFFDTEAKVSNKDTAGKKWTFDQHHLTVVWNFTISEHFKVLFESAYEYGPTIGTNMSGKIYLPKAYGEYIYSDAFKLRIGKFLPPFGIYNERHDATPTFFPTVLPQSVYGKHSNLSGFYADSLGQHVRAYPRFSTGLWTLGNIYKGEWGMEYNFYLVNGRGAQEHEHDHNVNKGVGARLVLSSPFGAHMGISYYRDKNCFVNDAIQEALGFDLTYDFRNLVLESGVVLPRFETLDIQARPTGHMQKRTGYYLMAGYTFFDITTPFAYFDEYDPDSDIAANKERDIALGINHMVAENVFIKSEVHIFSFEDNATDGYEKFIASIAIAF